MGEEKAEGVFERNRHRFALGGQAAALLSVLFLVPAIRKLRTQPRHLHRAHRRHGHGKRHFPILGH